MYEQKIHLFLYRVKTLFGIITRIFLLLGRTKSLTAYTLYSIFNCMPKHAKPPEKSDPRRPTKAKVVELFQQHPEESALDIGKRANITDKRVHQIATEEGWWQKKVWTNEKKPK